MITAKEAAKLIDQAAGKYEKICEKIGQDIKSLAEAGKRRYAICESGFWYSYESYKLCSHPTNEQEALMSCLRKYGYRVTIEKDGSSYIPRGLTDDSGNGPKYQNQCIVVRW